MSLVLVCASLRAQDKEVSVYVTHDWVYAEQILKDFEKKTGIKARHTTDTEATKTVALTQRLINEAGNPLADVFWNNECAQTVRLKDRGIIEPYVSPNAATIPAIHKDPAGFWTGFGARARVIAYNTTLVREEDLPKRIRDLADPKFKGKGVMARPVTGTTMTHVCALYARDGKPAVDQWLDALDSNDVMFVASNGDAMKTVAEGKRPFCLTDTDDAHAAALEGHPVRFIYPDQGAGDPGVLLIPNSVMLIKGARNPVEAKAFIDYLLSPEVEAELAKGRAAQVPLHPGVERPPHVKGVDEMKSMPVDWAAVGRMVETHRAYLDNRYQAGGPASTSRATWILTGGVVLAVLLLVARGLARRGEARV
jgi:iron(III) transport system substrate-binding protein